ncbi:MAG: hypothetical protein A2W26_08960 [Acidobacteria bacterium RBG_16_64_8]|nr:MAG: hypothetical protein A2W26_08960 [Acidobacteria bacterium RBG_16_64_8]
MIGGIDMKPFLAQFFELGEPSSAQTLGTQTMTRVLNEDVDDDEDRRPVCVPGVHNAGRRLDRRQPHCFESRLL